MKFKFATLVNRYEDQVFSLALYILGDRAEAEDVAQEVYLKLWQNIDGVESERAKLWLLKATRNRCIDRLRKRRREVEVDQVSPKLAQASEEPTGALAQDQLSTWLKEAIEKLKEPYKSLIVLRDMQQNSYEEIALLLSLSLSQVKVYLHRARQQLREALRGVEL